MDLFSLVVPEEQLHPNFRFLLVPGLSEPAREVISGWADGFVDRDQKFVREFQTTFNSSFWELYLFAAIKSLGWSCDFTHASPDFVAKSEDGHSLIAEAVIASNPLGYAPAPASQHAAAHPNACASTRPGQTSTVGSKARGDLPAQAVDTPRPVRTA